MSDARPPPAKPHRRTGKILLLVAGGLVALPLCAIALVLGAANTGAGQRLIEGQVAVLTGGQVTLRGLSGRFPDALRLAHGELHDAKGVWLSLDGVVLNWSPLALIGGTARIQDLTAGHVALTRLPVPAVSARPAPTSQGSFSLPVTVELRALHVARLDLGASLAGEMSASRIDGAGTFRSVADARLKLAIDRLDSPGTYRLDAAVSRLSIAAHLRAIEPPNGLLGGLARLPALGALDVTAAIDGPRHAERTDVKILAGKLTAISAGTIDLVGDSLALDVGASAPAMSPRPNISWAGLTLKAHMRGAFTSPDIAAHALVQDFAGGGASFATLTLDATGSKGPVDAHAVLTGLIIAGAKPELFAASPLDLTAHADVAKPDIPFRFGLRHSLLTADGSGHAGGDVAVSLHTDVPDLAPLAAIGHVDIRGRTDATASLAMHGDTTDVTLDGAADFLPGSQAPVAGLLGHTVYGATARLAGEDFSVTRAFLDGKAAHASVTGTDTGTGLAMAWRVGLTDLAALSPRLLGALQATGRIDGPRSGLAVQAEITGDIGTKSIRKSPVSITVNAQDLPNRPEGSIEASGSFAGSPLRLSATLNQLVDSGMHAGISKATWKSFSANADMVLAQGATVPSGKFAARMTRLADLAPVVGRAIAGTVTLEATSQTEGTHIAQFAMRGSGISAAGAGIDRLALAGTLRDPAAASRSLSLVLTADGLSASATTGSAKLTANGTLDALKIGATGALLVSGDPVTLSAQALVNAPGKIVTLQRVSADAKGEALRLLAPARIGFGDTVGVDRLRLSLGQATFEAAGRISPTLDFSASLRNVTPDLARPFAPSLSAAGVLTADARLTGTLAAPSGNLRVQAAGLRIRSGPGASLPAGNLLATASLGGGVATITAHAAAGPKLSVSASGNAPLQAGGALRVHTSGRFDLTLLDPILGATGKRAAGNLVLNADASGTFATPRIDGALTLTKGEVQDFVQGIRMTDIDAHLTEAGDTLQIQTFTAKAAPGTVSLDGSIGVLAPGLPIDIHVHARNARPLASDLLTATLDADLSIHGQAQTGLDASGKITVRRADINIPNSLPPNVAVLNVRRPGQKPAPPASATASAAVNLDLILSAPQNIFVRGHGLDAELGGRITIAGSSVAPQIGGGFQLRRGDISVAGTTLNFSKGQVGFDGTGVTGKIDPTLNFTADSTSGGVTATLAVTGYADAPKITLSSVPDLPQDEVLAHLLFGQSMKDLTAIQIAQIASALAELSGVTNGDPLAWARKRLGLDRLSVSAGAGTTTGATVEAGRYVAPGVYVGAKQSTSGGYTAANVQIDLTKRLKATAQLASGGGNVQGATPENDPGSSIGLSYQFDY